MSVSITRLPCAITAWVKSSVTSQNSVTSYTRRGTTQAPVRRTGLDFWSIRRTSLASATAAPV
ncbi:hypothetical protein ACFYOV_05325 [Streptomyces sp. NPDC005931]|uniref:hypothetical protein n=1 Tax=Streptomyces sp. NPDC005931 TaxID=3364737 RepID=UPI0036C89523